MRDFTQVAPSNLNGLIRTGRVLTTLNELDQDESVLQSIKSRITDDDGIVYYREGDIHDYVNGAENEFQGWESCDDEED